MMKKMMTKRTSKILLTLAIVCSIMALLSFIFFDIKIFFSTIFGFISSSLIMLASMKSYARMVDARVELGMITADDSIDTIDKIEDPYDLYSEEIVAEEEQDLVDVVKDERQKLKKNKRSMAQTVKDAKAALSPYRIGAYLILILGFFYLNRHGLLHAPAYILALTVPMLVVVFVLISNKENT